MSSQSRLSQIDPAVAAEAVDKSLPSFDANRATGYAELGALRSAKSASLVREQRLLALKFGGATTARADAAAFKLTQNEALRREIAATREVVETPLPDVGEKAFVIHGFVRRRDQTGIKGLTLALTDEQGNWLREFGYACTDARGYFLLRIESKSREKDPLRPQPGGSGKAEDPLKADPDLTAEERARRERERAAAGASGMTGAAPRASAEEPTNERTVQLRVFDRDGRVLHIEERPVAPRPDSIDYRLIILGDEDCGCAPPPEKSDGKSDPKSPRAPVAPPPAPVRPTTTPGAPAGRVSELKSYENPAPAGAQTPSRPLEAIRGIGAKRADALRKAGIDDVAEFSKSEGSALVKLAGFDKNPPKTTPAAKTPVAPRPVPAPAKPVSEKKSNPTKKKPK